MYYKIDSQIPQFFGLDGNPLNAGYIYIGAKNTNPEIAANRIQVYWDAEGLIPAAQPIRTIAGYPSRNGVISKIFCQSDYSLTVRSSTNLLIYSSNKSNYIGFDFSGDTGSQLIGHKASFSGAESTTVNEKISDFISLKADGGCACDGVTNDYTKIMLLHDNAPEGSTIIVTGVPYFTTPLNFTRRLNWVCMGEASYFKPSVGNLQDAITITGGVTIAGMKFVINMFSGAGTCQNGLVMNKLFLCEINSRIQVGGSAYSFVIAGCLENEFRLVDSVNNTTPFGSAYTSTNHLKIDVSGGYKTNANDIRVRFAGGSIGIFGEDQSQEGNNRIYGTIQGITGEALLMTGNKNLDFSDLHIEGAGATSVLTNCQSVSFKNVENIASSAIRLTGCNTVSFDTCSGSIVIDSDTNHTKIKNHTLGSGESITDNSLTTEMVDGGIKSTSTSTSLINKSGTSIPENFFNNPFVDIWTNGVSSAPDGFIAVSATFSRSSSAYVLNGSAYSCAVTSTATALGNGCRITPSDSFASTTDARWVSFLVPVFVATGQNNVIVYVYDGTQYISLEYVTTKDTWVPVRGSVLIPAGITPIVEIIGYNGTSFVASNFSVGGVNMCNGTTAPKYLINSGRRESYVVNSVSNAPAFIGQKAYISGTGKWYLAKGTASSADWIILN